MPTPPLRQNVNAISQKPAKLRISKRTHILLSAVLGFAMSFSVFSAMTLMMWPGQMTNLWLQGQLVPGGNNRYPSTLRVMSNADRSPMITAVSFYLWWLGVAFGTMIASLLAFRMLNAWRLAPVYEPYMPRRPSVFGD